MQTETPYRLALLGLLLLTVPIAGYHRHRAQRAGGSVSRRGEGLPLMFTLRACGLLGGGSVLLYLIHPPAMHWALIPLPESVRWAGAFVGYLAIPLVAWVFRSLGNNVTDTVTVRREHTLTLPLVQRPKLRDERRGLHSSNLAAHDDGVESAPPSLALARGVDERLELVAPARAHHLHEGRL